MPRPLEGTAETRTEHVPHRRIVHAVVKRLVDVIVGGLLLVVLAPLFVVVVLAIRAEGPGPAVFRQSRAGKEGRPFTMFKFRSMVLAAEELRHELVADNLENPVLFKMRHDPRITPVGRWLRRTSIDELPQLLNVLRGEMSLVGPRPTLLSEVPAYDGHLNRRFQVQPGMTGLWQVSGRSELSWEESVALDLTYVENWSLARDTMILAQTACAVVSGRGAY